MKKTYADECLERAEKATKGPWEYDSGNGEVETVPHRIAICDRAGNLEREQDVEYRYGDHIPEEALELLKTDNYDDLEFIAKARTDVPELARRLKLAVNDLRFFASHTGHVVRCKYGPDQCEPCFVAEQLDILADKLEAPTQPKETDPAQPDDAWLTRP